MISINEDDEPIMSEINITPLVDIMLVLLIIFMMVSTIVDLSAISVELPKAATGENSKAESVSIAIAKDGNYFLSGKYVSTLDSLKQQLEIKKKQNPQVQAIISADKSVSHGKVVKIIDLIRKLNISKFAISVELSDDAQK